MTWYVNFQRALMVISVHCVKFWWNLYAKDNRYIGRKLTTHIKYFVCYWKTSKTLEMQYIFRWQSAFWLKCEWRISNMVATISKPHTPQNISPNSGLSTNWKVNSTACAQYLTLESIFLFVICRVEHFSCYMHFKWPQSRNNCKCPGTHG